ncbi:MAG: hypothetical protein A4S09_11480 [Proteobacteria bacterium SG_bin7]|nr:MAG: hypothetical protein A4S09_11480 [Proteobacteria bacterium SG_bin7]
MRYLRDDVVASLIVFIVALPLSLGIALASGGTPEAGLITAVVGGIICGLMSGAPLVVAGPAAGLSAFVYQLIQEHGIATLAVITVLAGTIQFAMGIFRLGKVFKFVPKSILEGMLSVIGFIIATLQVHVLLGGQIPSTTVSAIVTLPNAVKNTFIPILVCGLVAITIQLFWHKLPKKVSWVPGALPAVIAATLLSLLWEMPRVKISSLIPNQFPDLFSFTYDVNGVVIAAFGLAIVASAETLLTAIAIDGFTKGKVSPANLDKELLAHGVANSVSGIVGGLPMTGVIVRSAVNVTSGARTRLSTILHGVWILFFVVLFPTILNSIPLTALAAILVVTGFKLLNLKEFIHVCKTSKLQGALWAITFVGILSTDLLTGLICSISIYAVVVLTKRMTQQA